MTILKCKDYAHNSYELEEVIEVLRDEEGWDAESASYYAESYSPLYEVEAEIEYDTESKTMKIVAIRTNGERFVPES